jgi:Protein of unknown function (DUF1822)
MTFTTNSLEAKTIWISIEDRDLPRIADRNYSNATAINNAELNQICLQKTQAWLTEIGIESTPTFSPAQMDSIWDVVNGFALTVGNRRLIVIPSDKFDREELSVPQEWVDIPAWMGDYYLAVQIDLDDRTMNIWGYTSHRTLRETGTFDRFDRTYSISSDFLIGDLDILWMAQLLDLQEISIVQPIVSLNSNRSTSAIDRLSQPSPYSPRLDLDFHTWAAILSNNDLRQQLHQRRLQVATLQTFTTPRLSLTDWLRQEFSQALEQGWQIGNAIVGGEAAMMQNLAVVRGGEMSIELDKLIDLQYQLDHTSVVMLVGIKSQDDTHVTVSVQIYPVLGTPTLPPQLKLSYITDTGEELAAIVSRSGDVQIQLPLFTSDVGTTFNIQLQLDGISQIEKFVV